jgi:hypothetical protein
LRISPFNCIYQIKIANPDILEVAYLLTKRWKEAKNIPNSEQNYIEQDANFYHIAINPNSVYNQPSMDSYGRDYYPKTVINPTPSAIRPPQDVKTQPLTIMPARDDAQTKEILDLQQKFKELLVQIANSKERRPRPTNQRTNIWYTNCGGYGHLLTEFSTSISNKNNLRCSYCKGKGHDVTTCWNLSDVRSVVASNNQWTE